MHNKSRTTYLSAAFSFEAYTHLRVLGCLPSGWAREGVAILPNRQLALIQFNILVSVPDYREVAFELLARYDDRSAVVVGVEAE